jgi:AsmA protein
MRLVKALIGMVLGLAALVGLALVLLPTERIAALATAQFEGATGRSLTIAGAVRPSFYPVLGATAREITIGNPDWASDTPLLQAEALEIGVNMTALWGGDVVVERVVLQSPVLDLRRDAQGRATWAFDMAGAQGGTSGAPTERRLSLPLAELRDASLRYRDAANGMDLRLTGLDATLRLPDLSGPLEVTARGRLNDQPVSLSLRAGNASQLIDGAVTPVTLQAELAGASVDFDGRAGLDSLSAEGALRVSLPALRPVLSALGQTGSELAAPYLPLSANIALTRTADGTIYARDVTVSAGAIRASGALDIATNDPRPRVTGQIALGELDLRAAGQGGAGGAGATGWSRDPIDASALSALDADVSITLAGLRSDAVTLGRVQVAVAVDNARAVVDLRELALWGGGLTGQFVANNRSGLSVRADMRARNIALGPMLGELADFRRLNGTASLDVNVLGSGNSVHAIMNSLRGEGRLDFARGEILGLDLAGMLRSLDMSYMGEGSRTVYDSITGSFAITDGVLRNDDLRLTSDMVTVTGRGTVGVGARVLDYRVVPVALASEGREGFRVPLLITGPWDAPRFRLDLEALAREQLREEQERLEALAREEAQRLEERAKAQAAAKLEQELGVQRQEGERLEDTLKRGVEEELGRRLQGLLGGN